MNLAQIDELSTDQYGQVHARRIRMKKVNLNLLDQTNSQVGLHEMKLDRIEQALFGSGHFNGPKGEDNMHKVIKQSYSDGMTALQHCFHLHQRLTNVEQEVIPALQRDYTTFYKQVSDNDSEFKTFVSQVNDKHDSA